MLKLRFNIANLLAVIFTLGVGFAVLRESSDLWDSGFLTLTIGVLLVSSLLAVHRTESRRAFWIGFALFGWGYLGLSLVPSIESRLLTTKGLAYVRFKLAGQSLKITNVRHSGIWRSALAVGSGSSNQIERLAITVDGGRAATSIPGQMGSWDAATGKLLTCWGGTKENFVKIGHSLLSLIAGILGGQLSRHLDDRNLDSAIA